VFQVLLMSSTNQRPDGIPFLRKLSELEELKLKVWQLLV